MLFFFVFMAKSNDRKAASLRAGLPLCVIARRDDEAIQGWCIHRSRSRRHFKRLVLWIASFLAMTRSMFGVESCGLLRYARNDAKRAWGRSPENTASLRSRLRERWVWVDGDSLREWSNCISYSAAA